MAEKSSMHRNTEQYLPPVYAMLVCWLDLHLSTVSSRVQSILGEDPYVSVEHMMTTQPEIAM